MRPDAARAATRSIVSSLWRIKPYPCRHTSEDAFVDLFIYSPLSLGYSQLSVNAASSGDSGGRRCRTRSQSALGVEAIAWATKDATPTAWRSWGQEWARTMRSQGAVGRRKEAAAGTPSSSRG